MTTAPPDAGIFGLTVRYSVRRWLVVLVAALVFAIVGYRAFRTLPIEAFPDVTDPSVDVVATFPGQSAAEVERRVTFEIERVLAGTPHMTNLRSVSVFGLSLVTLRFDEHSNDRDNRTQVAERLREASLPTGVEAVLGPQATPVGQVYRYTLTGARSLRDLRSLQDWVVERRLRAVPGVADVVTFGGFERQYEIRIDPVRLANVGVSVAEVFNALERTNSNAGGGYVGIGSQEFVVRGLGTIRDPSDLGAALVTEHAGTPVRIRDVADVVEGSTPRRGSVGRGEDDEVVEGIVLLRRGENPSIVLDAIRARIDELNQRVLPRGVRAAVFYDRGTLVRATLDTVGHNLLHGALLVIVVLWIFLRTLRGALVIAAVIPFALLFAFVGLRLMSASANLISLGAIDFGILVDGAVVVLEAVLHALTLKSVGEDIARQRRERAQTIATVGASVARPVGFAMLVIIAGLIPVFSLERVEGRIFAPMAFTYVFALVGSLVAATTLVPALATIALPAKLPHGDGRLFTLLGRAYARVLRTSQRARWLAIALLVVFAMGAGVYARGIGTEFLPELNEGGLYITAIFPSTIALDETRDRVPELRRRILALPETRDVLSHVGRPEQAAQAEGPNNVEFFVALAPMSEWRGGYTRRDLEDELRRSLAEVPGVQFNFSQPITDRVYETISGIIGQVVVKVRGDDIAQLATVAERIRDELGHVDGVTDLSIYQSGDTPQVSIELDRDRLARHGLTVDEAQETIEIALGGKVATALWDRERRYGVALRLPDAIRADPDELGRLVIGDAARRVTLAEVADIRFTHGRASIWREDMTRFVAVKFNVRGRDLGSVVADARRRIGTLSLPDGLTVTWGGEFENQQRAMQRLVVAVPLALAAIALILFLNFRRLRPAATIFATLPFAALASVAALRVLGENFSVSAAVGCIALLGQVALGGVLVCSRIDAAALAGSEDASIEGARDALRPVLLTTMLAALGLVPAALSHAMGSETQRPFAIAIIAGLVASLPIVLLVLPLFHRPAGVVRANSYRTPVPAAAAIVLAALVIPHAAHAQTQRATALSEADLLAAWLRSSREIDVLRSSVGAARFDVVTAGLLPNPELSVGASVLAAGTPPDGRVNYSVQLSMPIPMSGQIAARRDAALRALSVAEANVAMVLWQRSWDIHMAAIDLAFSTARLEMLAANVEQLADVERVIRSRAGAGVNTEYDARRIAMALAALRTEIATSTIDRMQAEARLVAAIGVEAVGNTTLTRDGLAMISLPNDRALLIAAALRDRPDLELARRGAAAAASIASRYRREVYPTPSLYAGALVTHGEASVSALTGVSFALPAFDRNQGLVGRALTERRSHEFEAEWLEVRIRHAIDSAFAARAAARLARSQYGSSAIDASADLLGRAQRAYQAGAFSVAELLDAYRATWDARAQSLALERAVAETDAVLAREAAWPLLRR